MDVVFQNKAVFAGWRWLLPFAALAWSGVVYAMPGGAGAGSEVNRDLTPEMAPDRSKRAAPRERGRTPWWKSWRKPRANDVGEPGRASSPRRSNAAGNDSKLDERIIAHSEAAKVRELVAFLVPRGWSVDFDVETSQLNREVVFHAETTRRRALDQLCLSLGWKGIFYPHKRLVLIVGGRLQ